MRKFEVGKVYGEDAVKYEVVKRTAKFVTILEVHHFGKFNETKKNERKVKVSLWDETEALVFELNSILVEKWKGKPYRLVIQRQRRMGSGPDLWEGEYTYPAS